MDEASTFKSLESELPKSASVEVVPAILGKTLRKFFNTFDLL